MDRYDNIIGVDPGKEGFITVIMGDGKIIHYPIPRRKGEIDLHSLSELIFQIAEVANPETTLVAIEKVHAIAGSSASGTFTFGGICFAIQMGFTMMDFPIVLIPPKQWQKEMYVGIKPNPDKKVMSITAAKRLFPNLSLLRTPNCVKPDNNLTDSLLIAEYARRKFK